MSRRKWPCPKTGHSLRGMYTSQGGRDKANLDIQWQQDNVSSTQGETLQTLMREILRDLEEAMREFAAAEIEIDDATKLT